MPPTPTVLIVGAGQAGFQAAASLREREFPGRIVLVGDEPGLPYQRPPLSKDFLLGTAADRLALRPAGFYRRQDIELRHGTASRIDRPRRRVVFDSGEEEPYDHLVLATGARNRVLDLPGTDLAGVHHLRTRADAEQLRTALGSAGDVVAVGAGFIGLEVASAARKLGRRAAVVDPLDRPMARSLSRVTSEHFARLHTTHGTALHLRRHCRALHGDDRVTAVELADGSVLRADLVVIGAGVEPNTGLAADARLPVGDGILVDEFLRTEDPAVFAIGDCARFPAGRPDRLTRLESVQNAADQARCVAATITGTPQPYRAVPWFWSHQHGARLQIAGLSAGYDTAVPLGDPGSASFSVLLFREGSLVCVESVNRPTDHMSARRILAAATGDLTPSVARQHGFDLRAHV